MLGQWDLGKKRSLNQLIAFNGVDTRADKVDFDNCGKLQWVPFDEGDDDDYYVAYVANKQGRDQGAPAAAGRKEGAEGKASGSGSTTRRKVRASGGGAHALSERLAIPESKQSRFLSVMCMMAFFLLMYACIHAGGSRHERSKGKGGGGGILETFSSKAVKMV